MDCPAQSEVAVELPLAADAHRDPALQLHLLLALHLLRPPQVEEVVDVQLVLVRVVASRVGRRAFLMELLDLLDLLVPDRLGVEGHLPRFFAAHRAFLLYHAHRRLARARGTSAACVVDDLEGSRLLLLQQLNLHQ